MKSLRISKRIIKKPSYLEQFHLEGNKDSKQVNKETKNTEKKEPTSFERKKRTVSITQNNEVQPKSKTIQRKRKSSEISESAMSSQNKQDSYVKISKRIIKMCRKGVESSHFSLNETEINNLSKDLHFIDESTITYEDIK